MTECREYICSSLGIVFTFKLKVMLWGEEIEVCLQTDPQLELQAHILLLRLLLWLQFSRSFLTIVPSSIHFEFHHLFHYSELF